MNNFAQILHESYAAQLDLSRALVVVAVPALALVTVVERYAARHVLHRLNPSDADVNPV